MTTENSQTPPMSERELRDAMVQCLIDIGDLRTTRAVDAFQTIPRHLAAPGADMAEAYDAESALITKTDATGVDISSVSAPRIQAIQIEQADIQPGMNVLEIGSGGVNAAYIAEMVGGQGRVVTVDIDPEVTARARHFLKITGHRNVTVITSDGGSGALDFSPFDRIVVTVQAADIPSSWVHQLKEGGRLVVPLRMRGMTRTVAGSSP
ncbi:methyltransferase domain-containing protein [Streptomyces sp. 1222.5]|uniref:methyltransferase domain-containing protein n=1 Tax=Streptomyces sp. 1222.5 TaxID=1881026 RepID=UPI003EB9203E